MTPIKDCRAGKGVRACASESRPAARADVTSSLTVRPHRKAAGCVAHAQTSRALSSIICVLVYLGSVVLANWLTTRYGFVPVGFGKAATAGTFAAGGALVVRDLLQDAIGRIGVAALILVAAALSFLVAAPAIATASAAAFLVAESLDMLAYTPLRAKAKFGDWRWRAAVAAGAFIGAIADSVIFLWIAFGRSSIRPALEGQLIGKYEVALAFIVVGAVAGAVLRKSQHTESA